MRHNEENVSGNPSFCREIINPHPSITKGPRHLPGNLGAALMSCVAELLIITNFRIMQSILQIPMLLLMSTGLEGC